MSSIKCKIFIGLFVFTLAFACVHATPLDAAVLQSSPPAQTQPDPARSRTFTGTIVRRGGQYLLRDSAGKAWKVDDPARVKSYEGKTVKVTGRLGPDATTIHIDSIETA
jgi:hypothetical protein